MRRCLVCLEEMLPGARRDKVACSALCRKRLERVRQELRKEHPGVELSADMVRTMLAMKGYASGHQYWIDPRHWPA